MPRLLSFAAGMALDVPPSAAVAAAAGAGYGALGLRFAAPGPSDAELRTLRDRVDGSGLRVLDVEYVNLTADDAARDWHLRLLEIGAALGAAHLITISTDPDEGRTAERFAALCDAADAVEGPRPALEFMRFTQVRTLADALAVFHRAGIGADRAGILVDALHLARGGTPPGAVADVDPALLPYLQVCDAPAAPPEPDPDETAERALGHEARHTRLLPGDGELDLAGLLRALPGEPPISVEVLSDALRDSLPVPQRAAAALTATLRVLHANSTG